MDIDVRDGMDGMFDAYFNDVYIGSHYERDGAEEIAMKFWEHFLYRLAESHPEMKRTQANYYVAKWKGNKSAAARDLGVVRQTLHSRLKEQALELLQ